MKKSLVALLLIMGFASTVYAGSFCCGDGKTKEQCCAERGKIYCPSDETCRTQCLNVTEPDCIGGCINPEGVCCDWCPSIEVCKRMNKCQQIVDGCYECVDCPVPNPCTKDQCMNEEGICCDECPRVCPEGECLVSVDGCYECAPCKGPTPPTPDDDDDDDDDDGNSGNGVSGEEGDGSDDNYEPPCGECEVCENGICVNKMVKKWTGECCEEEGDTCCPLTEDCACYPTRSDCLNANCPVLYPCRCFCMYTGCSLIDENKNPKPHAIVDCYDTRFPDGDCFDCVRDIASGNPHICECEEGYTEVLNECCLSELVCKNSRKETCCPEDRPECVSTEKDIICCPKDRGCQTEDGTPFCCEEGLKCVDGTCCPEYTNGEGKTVVSTVYWIEEMPICCNGQVYEPYGEGTGKEKGHECCTDEYMDGVDTCGNGVAEIINPKENGYKTTCCPYYKNEDGTCNKKVAAYMNGNNIYCCKNVYTSSVQKDGTKYYGCCEEESYIQKAEHSTRGVEACCSEGGTAFVTYPWNSTASSSYWFETHPEYGMTDNYSNCCKHSLADNAYGGQDCCTPTSVYDTATSSYVYVETTATTVKDYDFEICCPEGREAYYTGTVSVTNDDTGESKTYPKGACCGKDEVVLKYGKYNNVNNYTCCDVSEDSNYVRVAVQGAPEDGFEVCCEKYTSYSSGEGTIPEAYWNGSSGSCCNGTVYQSKEGVWRCCEDTITTGGYYAHPYGQSVCSVENAASGGDTLDCCPRYMGIKGRGVKEAVSYSYDGTSTGENSVYCCNGEVYHSSNNGDTYKNYGCCSENYGTLRDDYVPASSAEQVASLTGKGYTCEQYSETSYSCWRSWSELEVEGKITTVIGIPEGRKTQTCCAEAEYTQTKNETDNANEYTEHALAGAYWNGSQSNCCYGTIYDRLKDETLSDAWGCCNEWDDMKVVDVAGTGIPTNKPHKLCCSYYDDEGVKKPGKAYWNGSYSDCCHGDIYDNGDGTYHCCTVPYKYNFKTKTRKSDEKGNCSVVLSGEYTCCPCEGEKIWDYESEKCVDCPEGEKANCYECIATATQTGSTYGGCPYYSSSSSDVVCFTITSGQHVSCTDYSTGSTDNCGTVSSGTLCMVCPEGETFYMDFSNNSFDYGCD